MSEQDVKVKSIKKTVDILNCFIEKQPLGITEISQKLGLHKSNVHNILSTLAALDYVGQEAESGKYYLGAGVLRLSRALGERYNFRNIAVGHMRQLADSENEIVALTTPMGKEVFYMEMAYPRSGRAATNYMRTMTNHMHTTSCGKAMMAYMPESFVEEYFQKPAEAPTEHTITTLEDMQVELAAVRKNGYAVDNMETDLGVRCVGVPILDRNREVVGALSISGSVLTFNDERVSDLAEKLKEAVSEIEKTI